MKKVTQKELRDAVDAHSQSMASAKSAANLTEKARELKWVMNTGRNLAALLARPMRATMRPELVRHAESMVDQSAVMLGTFHDLQVEEAEKFADGFVEWAVKLAAALDEQEKPAKRTSAKVFQMSDFR